MELKSEALQTKELALLDAARLLTQNQLGMAKGLIDATLKGDTRQSDPALLGALVNAMAINLQTLLTTRGDQPPAEYKVQAA